MNKKIAIVHKSEIFRKGLNAIIKSYFNLEVIQFAQVEDLKDYPEIQSSLHIVFIEIIDRPDVSILKKLIGVNDLKVVGIQSNSKYQNTDFKFDSEISIFESSHLVQELISDYIQTSNSETKEQEGDELTQREKDVLKLVALGHSNKDIADKLFISIHTVISHRKNITEKLGIKSISGLTVYAILNKIIDTENLNPENLI